MQKIFIRTAVMWIVISFTVNTFALAQTFIDTGPHKPQRHERPSPLTDEQKARVKSILSKYDADSLTASDAKAIFQEFRRTGLPGGPALLQAIRDAGFDPERIRALAPPRGPGGGEMRPGIPQNRGNE